MDYTVPQLKIWQEFTATSSSTSATLNAGVIAPHYGLHRFSVEAERAVLGAYNAASGNTFSAYPDKQVGSTVNMSSVAMFCQSAVLKYLQLTEAGLTANGGNRFTSAATNFKTGNGSALSSSLNSRPVQIGDYARVTFTPDVMGSESSENDEAVVIETSVIGIAAVEVAATIGATTPVSGNASGNSASATPASRGTYEGTKDTTYIVRITSGGTIGTDVITYSVSTTNGYDSNRTASKTGSGTIAIGNYGVILTLVGAAKLTTGDQFTIAATAAGAGAYRTLIFADTITGALTTDSIKVELGKKEDVQLENSFFTHSADAIVVGAAATHTDIYDNVYNILGGTLVVQYKELLPTYTSTYGSVSSAADVENLLGPITVENPLSLMVYAAALNANGKAVYFVSLATDDLSGYADALTLMDSLETVWSIVPWDASEAVKNLIKANVLEQSNESNMLWRTAWFGSTVGDYKEVYTGTALVGTLVGTTLTVTSGLLKTHNVLPGDQLRVNYRDDGFGNEIYDTYIIKSVTSETVAQVIAGPASPLSVAVKVAVYRAYTSLEYAAAVAAEGSALSDSRCRVIWADRLSNGIEYDLPKAVLAAALAGLRSSVAPHQPLTRVEVTGFSVQSTRKMDKVALNVIAAGGIWIVLQSSTGAVFTRHQLTTDMTTVDTREDSIVSNADQISKVFKAGLDQYYGNCNVSDNMLRLLEQTVTVITLGIATLPFSDRLGPQLITASIAKLEKDPLLADSVRIVLKLDTPTPLNNPNVYLLFK